MQTASRAEVGNDEDEDEEEEEEEEILPPVKVIQIRRSTSRIFKKSGHRSSGFGSNSHDDDGEEDEVVTPNYDEVLPFALVAPESGGSEEGKFVRVFKYVIYNDSQYHMGILGCDTDSVALNDRYGTLDVLNPEHSDFPLLRNALLGHPMKVSQRHAP